MELSVSNCFYIYQFQTFDHINMVLVIDIFFFVASELIYIGVDKGTFIVGQTNHLCCFSWGDKFSKFVEELERIPLSRIVRSRQNDTSHSVFSRNSYFCRWSSG